MKRVKQITAGLLLTWSFLCLVRGVDVALNPRIEAVERRNIVLASFMLGLPALAGSGWLMRNLQQQQQRQERDRLQGIFFQMLQQGQGYISILPFALQTQLDATEAKAYLDDRAREFQADFQVSDSGKVFYYFDLEGISPKQLGAATSLERFDVVLDDCPAHRRREVVRVIRQLSDLSWQDAKALIQHAPLPVQQNVDRSTAERSKKRLESAGATVLLVVKS